MSRPFVELIAAVGPRWELGYQGGLPWGRIKGDMALFRQVTADKAVIMGRRTWESLPPAHRPLKGRLNLILTRDKAWARAQPEMPWVLYPGHERWGDYHDPNSVRAAIDQARSPIWDKSGVAIIGGGQIYRAALEADLVDVIHLSVIHPCEMEAWQREAAGWGSQAWAYRGSPCWEHDVTFPALAWEGWALAQTVRHEPEGGAPHGWTQLRLVRDPTHQAQLRPAKEVGGLPLAWLGMERI